ncbi:hypothetical protein CIY_19100 [Butyrivibrio fibrisolvens 16/4]|nr:hypothetical protein CIY_19100 [Butyrivibrio fibrisolvens 16/4]
MTLIQILSIIFIVGALIWQQYYLHKHKH